MGKKELLIDLLIENISKKYKLGKEEILDLFQKKDEISIPLSALSNRKLGMLESVVFFLRRKEGMKNRDIAKMLNRDNKTIWSSYNNACRKLKK